MKRLTKLLMMTMFLAISFLTATMFMNRSDLQILTVQISKSSIVAVGKNNKALWIYDTKIENLLNNDYYQQHMDHRRTVLENPRGNSVLEPLIKLVDLKGHGDKEVLFAVKTDDEHNGGNLLCLNSKGKLLWNHPMGREMKFGARRFPSDYVIRAIDALDMDKDGKREVLIISYCFGEYPAHVSILDASGEVKGEYWNSGQFNDFGFSDLAGDGGKELILAGQNEEYHKACLVVFRAADLKGGSPNSPEFSSPDIGAGSEQFYVLLPQTKIDQILGPGYTIDKVEIGNSGDVTVTTNYSKSIFRFDRQLHLSEIILGDDFQRINRDLAAENKLESPLDIEKTKLELKRGLLYHNGKTRTWVGHWAQSNPR